MAFRTVFWGQGDVWMIKIMIKTNAMDMDVCFFEKKKKIFEKKNLQKPCLFLKSGFLPLVYWFENLNLTDKHGTKNL